MTNSPCCPSKISLMKVKIASQNTGVISTPNAGGILPFASLNKGSEGHATTAQGNSFRFVSGYHDATTRHNIAKDIKFRNGPNAAAVGATQASVSASNNPLPEEIATPTVSVTDEAIVGSTIDNVVNDDARAAALRTGDVGTTNPETPFGAIAAATIAQPKIAEKRNILIAVLLVCLFFSVSNGSSS